MASVILSAIQTATIYLYFTYQVSVQQIDIAQYTILISSTTLFFSEFISLFSKIGIINNSVKAYGFLKEYNKKIDDNCIIKKKNNLIPQFVDYCGSVIKFENVSFCYPESAINVLHNINIEIPCHKKMGIVGVNGSGKTTLVKLILRLYRPTKGKITINGIDISLIHYTNYIKHIGVVLQDLHIA